MNRTVMARNFNLALLQALGLPTGSCMDITLNNDADDVLSVTVKYAISAENARKMTAELAPIPGIDIEKLADFGLKPSDFPPEQAASKEPAEL